MCYVLLKLVAVCVWDSIFLLQYFVENVFFSISIFKYMHVLHVRENILVFGNVRTLNVHRGCSVIHAQRINHFLSQIMLLRSVRLGFDLHSVQNQYFK